MTSLYLIVSQGPISQWGAESGLKWPFALIQYRKLKRKYWRTPHPSNSLSPRCLNISTLNYVKRKRFRYAKGCVKKKNAKGPYIKNYFRFSHCKYIILLVSLRFKYIFGPIIISIFCLSPSKKNLWFLVPKFFNQHFWYLLLS